MNYLLDTHVFLWLDAEPEKLSKRVAEIIEEKSNSLYLSLASIWEMQIKVQLGKLTLNSSLEEVITSNQADNRVQLLSITLEHILTLNELADHHRDPFDRLLIAQAKAEKLILITNDAKLGEYAIQQIW